MTPIESLPAKWRETPSVGAGEYSDGYNDAMHHLADELESTLRALSAQPKDGELLALAEQVFRIAGGDVECEPHPTPERALEVLRDLRQCYDESLASRRVEVTDARVERACVAGSLTPWTDPKWDKDGRRDAFRAVMRAALTAALQPDSGEVRNGD